ncbi:unnamed protein product [Gulo gulo]|uniref:Uncharacterized protein n=1 Tax=Gulo gulo TaxID=48420 RepID=A0A9X9PVC1_GULGU|nr:unnamed protein product [Gulo gulo]
MALPPLAHQLGKTRDASQTLLRPQTQRLLPRNGSGARRQKRIGNSRRFWSRGASRPQRPQGRSAWGAASSAQPRRPPHNALQARRVPSRPHTHTCRQRDRTVTKRSEGQRGRCPFRTGWAAWTPGRRAAAPGGAVSRLGWPSRDKPRGARDSPRDTGEFYGGRRVCSFTDVSTHLQGLERDRNKEHT